MNKEEFIAWLRTLLDKRGLLNGTRVKAYLKGEKLDNLNLYSLQGSSYEEKIYLLLNNIEQLPVCKVCGSPVKFKNSSIGYQTYCSLKCSGSSPEVQSKKSQAHWNKTEEERKRVIDARKQGIIDKYGVANVSLSEEVKAKRQKTFDEKWGGNPLKNQTVKDKINNTNINRYGVIHPSQSSLIKIKLQKRKLKSFSKIIEVLKHNNFIPLFMEEEYKGGRNFKYNVKCLICNQESTITLISGKPTLCRHCFSNRKKIEKFDNLVNRLAIYNMSPLFTAEEYEGRYTNIPKKIKCNICNSIQDYVISVSNPFICSICNPSSSVSSQEKEIVALIKSWGIDNVKTSVRDVINPYELDIYLPDYKLAIEFHGLYWHSEISGSKGRSYHLNKFKLCKAKNVDLIQIFEDEWVDKKDIIISILKNRLGLTKKKYFARNLSINIVSVQEQRDFINGNHIQGYCPAHEALGLYSGTELISIVTFISSRHNKKYTWELLRFVNKLDTKVIGGLSKLLSHFKRNHPNESLISYCDKRLFNGDGYLAVGFKQQKDSPPNYYYTLDYRSRESRIHFQKHKLSKILENFDLGKTEWENMMNNGYDRIWDAGMFIFTIN